MHPTYKGWYVVYPKKVNLPGELPNRLSKKYLDILNIQKAKWVAVAHTIKIAEIGIQIQ